MLKLGVGGSTTVVEAGEGYALSLAHPRLRTEAMKTAEGRALTRDVGRMLADGDVVAPLAFASDWGSIGEATTLDQSGTALSDSGRWPSWGIGGALAPDTGGIITADGLGFPSGMVNVMRQGFHANAPESGGWSVRIEVGNNTFWDVDAMTVGETLFHRWYYRNAITNHVEDLLSGHFVQGWGIDEVSGSNCAFSWEFRMGALLDGTINWHFASNGETGSLRSYRFPTGFKNQTYMVEIGFTKVANHSWQVRIRIDGSEITPTNHDWPAAFDIGNNCLNTVFIGNSDPGSNWRQADGSPNPDGPYPDQDFMYWGGFAAKVSSDPDDWIGAYVPGEAD